MGYAKIINKDLFGIEGVLGVVVLSADRGVIFEDLTRLKFQDLKTSELGLALLMFNKVDEIDLLFECYRVYIRKTPLGLLWIIMAPEASGARIRQQCDIICSQRKRKRKMI